MCSSFDHHQAAMAESSRKTGLYTDLHSSKFSTCMSYFSVTLSDFNALREEVKCLMELIQKLVIEFKAVKREVEASHTDIMDSVHLAIALCKAQQSTD